MPKRVVDGDALSRSDKLLRIEPVAYRAEYAYLLTLSLANGTFECDPRRVWSNLYSYNRPDVSPEQVKSMLDEFERAKMLFRWREPNGKVWGHWVGCDKPGRLPAPSRVSNGETGVEVPKQELDRFVSGAFSLGCDEGTSTVAGAYAESTESVREGSLGFGLGLGFGFGSGLGSSAESKIPADGEQESDLTSTEVRDEILHPPRPPNDEESAGIAERLTTPSGTVSPTGSELTIQPQRDKDPPDHRHTPFRIILGEYWRAKNHAAPEMPWQGRDAKALAEFLAANPRMNSEQFRELLQNRARSQVAHGERVYRWIADVTKFSEPLDRYNRPAGAQDHGTYAQRNQRATIDATLEAVTFLEDRARSGSTGDELR